MSEATFAATAYGGTGPENYERYFVPTIGAPLADDLVAAASLRTGERVLDVACGTGVVTRLAAAAVGAGGAVAGLDVNPGMLAVARAATPAGMAIDWYESSAEAMPLADGAFDVGLCQMGLQFMPDKPRALQEMRRVLRPEGRLVVNLPGPTPGLFAELADALARHIDPRCAGFVNVVFSLHEREDLHRLMSDAGFEEIEVERTQKALALPPPRDFLWQYVHSTPLAEVVAKAPEQQHAALADDVCKRWQAFLEAETLRLTVPVTTVRGRNARPS